MSKDAGNLEKLKGVLIVGPRHKIPESIRKLYDKPGYLILGDGVNPVKKYEIQNLLGQIGPGSRVDVWGHGEIGGKGFMQKRFHKIDVVEGIETTKELMQSLSQITGRSPVETHVWSCFGGLAARDSGELPKGSCIIAHGSESQSIISSVVQDGIRESIENRQRREAIDVSRNKLNYESVVSDLHLGCEQKCFVGISGVSGTVGFRIPPKKIFDLKCISSRINSFKLSVVSKISRLPDKLPDIIVAGKNSVKECDEKKLETIQTRSIFSKLCEGKTLIQKIVASAKTEQLSKLATNAQQDKKDMVLAAIYKGHQKTWQALKSNGFPAPNIQQVIISAPPKNLASFIKEVPKEELLPNLSLLSRSTPETCEIVFKRLNEQNIQTPVLLKAHDSEGCTLFHLAAKSKNPSVLKWLLKEAENNGLSKKDVITAPDKFGKSAYDYLNIATGSTYPTRAAGAIKSESIESKAKPSLVEMMKKRFTRSSKVSEIDTKAPSSTPNLAQNTGKSQSR